MKKIYLYIFLSASLISCEKDEIISQKEISQPLQELPYVENIEYQNLPEDFFNFFQEKNFSKNQEYQNFSFGKVRKDMPAVKIVNKTGKISYTFVLENQEDSILFSSSTVYFDNLVVYKDDNRADLVHIIRYIPTSEWYNNSKDFKEYSGSVIIYLPTGKKLSELQVVNGNRDQANQKNFNKVSCDLKLESQTELCTQLHEDDGTPIGELKCTTTYHYTWECATGGSEGGSETGTSGPDHEEVPLGGGSTAPTLPKPEEKIISELEGKAKCIFENLMLNSTDIAETIKKFDGDFPVSHLKFSINNLLPSGNYGTTSQPQNNWITIEMSNTQLAKISDLGSATALIHEIIHAEIYRKMLSAAQVGTLDPSNMSIQQQVDYVDNLRNDFPGIYDYYIQRYKPTWNHNMMAQHYIGVIADAIQQYDNYSLSRESYEDIAWAGLRKLKDGNYSVAWNNLSYLQQQRILKNLSDYFFNGPSNCK